MIYELREYIAHENAEELVHARFRDATLPLFEKHGLAVAGFWADQDDPSRILYLLQFEDSKAQSSAWQDFQQDPEWQQAKSTSEADGPIVASMTSRNLRAVPYWAGAHQGATR